jgi:hypothetical protein
MNLGVYQNPGLVRVQQPTARPREVWIPPRQTLQRLMWTRLCQCEDIGVIAAFCRDSRVPIRSIGDRLQLHHRSSSS